MFTVEEDSSTAEIAAPLSGLSSVPTEMPSNEESITLTEFAPLRTEMSECVRVM